MLRLRAFDDVTQLEMSSRRSRLAGYGVAAYVVRGVLVDTGFPRLRRTVARFLDATPLRGAFVTHQHEDHAGNVELVGRRGVPLAMGALTRELVTRPARIALYRRAIWGAQPPLATPSAAFEDPALTLVATPGHTPDHHCVWDAEGETLFSGDLFLGVKVRVAHRHERPRRTLESVRLAARLRPRRLFCAHRGAVPDPVAALRAKAEWMAETIGRIDRRIAEGWPDRAIRDDVLGGEVATGYVTSGEYARLNYVRAVREEGLERPGARSDG